MLPVENRLRDSESFRHAIRRGARAGTRLILVHVLAPDAGIDATAAAATRAGLVVSRAVGDAVTRNRVKRRLRHLLRADLALVPGGSLVVVRALPAAAGAAGAELAADLVRCLSRAVPRSAVA